MRSHGTREANLFYAELLGRPPRRRAAAISHSPQPAPAGTAEFFESIAAESSGAASFEASSFDPRLVFDRALATGEQDLVGESEEEAWEVVARPGSGVARGALRRGDLVVQRGLGEGRLSFLSVLGEDVEAESLYGWDGRLRPDMLVLRAWREGVERFAEQTAVARGLPTLTQAINANKALFELVPWYAEWQDPSDSNRHMSGFFWMFSDALMWEAPKSGKWSSWSGTTAHPLPRRPFGGVAIGDRARLVRLPCTGKEATEAADLLKFSQADLVASGGSDELGATADASDSKVPCLLPTAELYDRTFFQADVRIDAQPKMPTEDLDADTLAYNQRVNLAFSKAPSNLGPTGSRNTLGTPGKIWAIADGMDAWNCCKDTKRWTFACINHGFHQKLTHVGGKPVAKMWQYRGGCHPWDHEDYSQIFQVVAGWCLVKGIGETSNRWRRTAEVYLDRTLSKLVRDNGPVPALRYHGTPKSPQPSKNPCRK
ncbi:MAG TPA: hypothetical protein VGK73_40855 [Polyangiaceae bacterium]